MPDLSPADQEFLNQLHAKIAANISQEQFGVTELAEAMAMSRSNLLRKVKKATNLSVSQLISQVRLEKSMVLLRAGAGNVSEVAAQVGFSSTSYFIKCFREYYGYPPGEVGKRANEPEPIPASPPATTENKKRELLIGGALGIIVVFILSWFVYNKLTSQASEPIEKSIAVLPFKNDSQDSTNVYLINGLMESTLNNLQKIRNLKVISRTSTEIYRHNTKIIPEMAKELNVNYFVEGSGQKIDNRIVLNIQLVDATDRHLWSRQYRREANDIFALQQEIAQDIAEEIQVFMTPDEKTQLEKIPTQNAAAYDSFLKGLELLNNRNNFSQSLKHFQDAIHDDKTFAMAYACAGIACYFLDIYQLEKPHIETLSVYADNAMRYDPTLSEGYLAKGMYYLLRKEYPQALPHLEKGLEYKPNSTLALSLLADFYSNQMPNTGKYLEYALKGLRLGAHSGDSVSISYIHLRLANALIQTGFVDKSLEHLNRSLDYFPNNAYARYIKAFVLYAKHGNLKQTRQLLVREFNQDTSRFDILQDIGKVSYYLGEYDTAYICYKRFNRYREQYKLDVFQYENMLIGKIYERMGEKSKAKELYSSHRSYIDRDQTAYKNLALSFIYCTEGNKAKALEHLKLFSQEDNIQYWIILFLDKAPDMTPIERSPEFKQVADEIERKFWATHEKLKQRLEEKGVM